MKAFKAHGYVVARITASHYIMHKPGEVFALSIPVHGHKTLKPGLLRSQIRTAGLTVEQFIALL
ncbi:MAG: type II toxin-antitoxin system HicA family toxin [Planctomycetes bacterium]|nr:type II toxin-antitoxin system HicA family toxin [Planctomycetota bacterium]